MERKKFIFFTTLAIVAVILFWKSLNSKTSKRQLANNVNAASSPIVPKKPIDFNLKLDVSLKGYDITRSQQDFVRAWKGAIKLIISVRKSKHLQTRDDKRIMRLLWLNSWGKHKSSAGFGRHQNINALYNCSTGGYSIRKGIKVSVQYLAVLLYHELWHEVECLSHLKKNNLTHAQAGMVKQYKNYCELEYGGYAAQVRMFLALDEKGLLPSQVTKTDAEMAVQTLMVWKAFNKGTICSLLQKFKRMSGLKYPFK